MAPAEIEETGRYIDDIIESTKNGSIVWTEANPTTYIWTTSSPFLARLVIQRTASGTHLTQTRQVMHSSAYQFQALQIPSLNAMFSVNSDEITQLQPKLHALFEEIQSSITRKGLSFLRSVLPPAK